MPEFRHPSAIPVEASGPGWRVSLLAGEGASWPAPMAARRWRVERGVRTPPRGKEAGERFLYVVSGRGSAHLAQESFELGPEDLVWLEPEDVFSLEAGAQTLEVLEASSPR